MGFCCSFIASPKYVLFVVLLGVDASMCVHMKAVTALPLLFRDCNQRFSDLLPINYHSLAGGASNYFVFHFAV